MQAPSTNWKHVIENLDHEGFYIPNQEAFSFFMSVYKRVCQVCFHNRISSFTLIFGQYKNRKFDW